MKTKEQIESLAINHANIVSEPEWESWQSRKMSFSMGYEQAQRDARKCGVCTDEPCNFEFCPDDTVLAGEYNQMLNTMREREAKLVEALKFYRDEFMEFEGERIPLVRMIEENGKRARETLKELGIT